MSIDTKAPGPQKPTGMPKTPPPKANFERDLNSSYGNNQYPGRVVLDPGQKRTNDYLNPSDEVRDKVINQGLKPDDASPISGQIRKLSGKNVPDAFGMKSPDSKSTIPDRLGDSNAQPVRKPS